MNLVTTSLAAVVAVVNPYKLPVTNCAMTTATYSATKRTAPTNRSQTRRHKPETPLRVSGSRAPIGLLLVGRLLDLIHGTLPSGSVQLGPQLLHAGMILLDAFSHFGPPCSRRSSGQESHDGGVAGVKGAGPDARPAAGRQGPPPTVVAVADVAIDALAAGLGHGGDAVLLGTAEGDADGDRDGDVLSVNGGVVVCHVCNP